MEATPREVKQLAQGHKRTTSQFRTSWSEGIPKALRCPKNSLAPGGTVTRVLVLMTTGDNYVISRPPWILCPKTELCVSYAPEAVGFVSRGRVTDGTIDTNHYILPSCLLPVSPPPFKKKLDSSLERNIKLNFVKVVRIRFLFDFFLTYGY